MCKRVGMACLIGVALLVLSFPVAAQISTGPGGVNFDEAAKIDPASKDFHTNDGVLTIAYVTHTAGNGFFNPCYVGATTAAQAFTAMGLPINILRLGPPAANDDIPATLAIINQVLTDPKLDALAITTPQVGAYEDIINKAFELGIPVATFNSFDPTIPFRSQISHTGQSSSAAAIGGEALVKCLLDKGVEEGVVLMPNSTTLGNVEVNERVQYAAKAIREGLEDAGVTGITVDDGQGIGVDVRPSTADATQDIIKLIESTPNVVGLFGPNGAITPAVGNAVRNTGMTDDICAFGFDLGPAQLDLISTGDLDGSMGQQPYLQGFWPVAQLILQIDRGVSAANLDTLAELVTQENLARFQEIVKTRYTN
ncbi:substrate-binding domain-containing protein [candidate division KSB3 bacterium]|uniref:Substrate-binding domain-containing protein n=1 Tax=candidate division KSB3 bacterium TaxID=2044937 RepID=A0A9D5JYA4_9BACT|nr:substrate-binding domain-containing protein [candidate division KSB3 bacterium]MBD3326544.1 substrate-binding domain-containing protein [candidate division KSB3 bacterium]